MQVHAGSKERGFNNGKMRIKIECPIMAQKCVVSELEENLVLFFYAAHFSPLKFGHAKNHSNLESTIDLVLMYGRNFPMVFPGGDLNSPAPPVVNYGLPLLLLFSQDISCYLSLPWKVHAPCCQSWALPRRRVSGYVCRLEPRSKPRAAITALMSGSVTRPSMC